MIRFVLGPGEQVIADLRQKLPGRGVWITARKDLVRTAVEKQLFSRGFKKSVVVTPELVATIESQLRGSLTSLLSLARKANVMVVGNSKTEEEIRSDNLELVFQANDKEGDAKRKLARLIQQNTSGPELKNLLSSQEMDALSGSVNTVHIGIRKSGLSEKIRDTIRRIEIFSDCE